MPTETPEVRAVFWDIGGVILNPESVERVHEEFVREVVEARAPDASPAEAVETWRRVVGEYFRERDGTEFRPAAAAYDRAVAEIVGEPVPEDEWRPRFEAVGGEALRPEPGALETVERLAETDLHVGVVSDVDTEEGLRILETFGIRDAFDSIITSEMVGRTKPDRRMFETALREAGVEPGAAVMIGDRYDHDVAGASAAGLTTVAYGADDGPAVDRAVDDLREVLDVVGVEAGRDGAGADSDADGSADGR